MNEHQPIKRDPAIVELSRDHHFGLLLVWKIKYGAANNISANRVCDYVLYYWEQELGPHFKKEEEYLFPLLTSDDSLRVRAMTEHTEMRNLLAAIKQSDSDLALCEQFAGLLELHIRFEERELFNHIQNAVSKDQLDAVSAHLSANDHPSDQDWKDQFWVKEKS